MNLKTLVLSLPVALLTACASSGSTGTPNTPDAPGTASATTQEPTTQNTASAPPMAEQKTVYTSKDPFIEPTLSAACGWKKPTMYFATDSDKLGLVSDVKVDLLATCLKADPLHDRSIVLTGYADERGEADANLELGLDRANAVKAELVAQGVSPKRIETYSRGEYLADGDDTLAYDRRVVVNLNK